MLPVQRVSTLFVAPLSFVKYNLSQIRVPVGRVPLILHNNDNMKAGKCKKKKQNVRLWMMCWPNKELFNELKLTYSF